MRDARSLEALRRMLSPSPAAKSPGARTASRRSARSRRTPAAVGRRAGDHLEDFRGGGLPLESFLGLVEQAHVFDRDHGLIANVLTSSICLPAKGRTSGRQIAMTPRPASANKGTASS